MNANTENWLKKADEDEQTCRMLLNYDAFPAAVVCFHCQQMAEKYLKAFLTNHGVYFRRTHDLVDLLNNYLIPIDEGLKELEEPCFFLADFGVLPRYPGDYPEMDAETANKAFQYAQEIKAKIKDKIL